MKVFLEASLEMVAKKTFTNRDTGTVETKYRTYLKDEDGDIINVNCNTNFEVYKGREGVAKLGVYEQGKDGKGYWLSLLEFVPKDLTIE